MNEQQYMQRRLTEAFESSRHHSFLGSLDGVTNPIAQWVPPHYKGFPHMNGSILKIGVHAAGDKLVLASLAFSDGTFSWGKVEEEFLQRGGNIATVRAMAQEGHEKALKILETLTNPQDFTRECRYYHGQTLTAYEIFCIMAEHDLYHAGQVNYVKCLYEGARRQANAQSN
jgi:hypothetical protein